MQIIYYLGHILSQKIGISTAASRGLIKLAISEEFGPFKSLETLGVRDFQKFINNTLKKRLMDLNINNYQKIVDFLLDEVLDNQSIITMEKI
jgi:hypothetical protein